MAQYARPASDVLDEGWDPIGGPATLYECVDEESASDTDYIQTTTECACAVGLAAVTDPESSSGHVVRWRWKSTGSTPPQKATLTLREGSTVRATCADASAVGTSWTDGSYTLLSAEADAITDYSNLNIYFEATTLGTGESIEVSWCELEVPDAPAAGEGVSNLMLLGVG